MKVLRPILDVRELPPALAAARRGLPSLGDFVSPEPRPNEREALAYLRDGVSCGVYLDPGLCRDVLQPGRTMGTVIVEVPGRPGIGPGVSYTDGTWIWWGALLYYVATYHLWLPDEFLRHARGQSWRIDPSAFDVNELDDSLLDAAQPIPTAGAPVP